MVLFILLTHKYIKRSLIIFLKGFFRKSKAKGEMKMNNLEKRLRRRLTQYLSFPKDVMLDLPKITSIGNIHTYIENHQGIISYNEEELIINSQIGQIKLTGSSFVIREMLYKELLLEGEVSQIIFLKNNL